MTYVNKLNSWKTPSDIAKSIGVPTYAPNNPYNFFIFTFWRVSGATDAVKFWVDPMTYLGNNDFGKTT